MSKIYPDFDVCRQCSELSGIDKADLYSHNWEDPELRTHWNDKNRYIVYVACIAGGVASSHSVPTNCPYLLKHMEAHNAKSGS